MISDELRADIRRKFFGEHWKVGTIADTVGVHHTTVARAIESERFTNTRYGIRPSALDPYKAFITLKLEEYPRLTATRLHEMVRGRGYPGGIHVLRRFVSDVRPVPKSEAFLRLAMLPGEQAQVDWAHFGKISVGDTVRNLSCFVMVLSYSRAIYARFVLDMTMESFLRCHVLAFRHFGGIPRTALYDNLKTVVLERVGDVIRFHPRFLDFAGHYHFAPIPVGIARGNEKGRVERAIRYMRGSFFAAREYRSLSDINAQLGRWIEEVSDARPHHPGAPGDTVAEVFERDERDVLMKLPAHAFPCEHVQPIRSGKTPYVRFDCNDYSIPYTLIRKPLTLIADETTIRILDGDAEVARHERCWDKRKQHEDPAHIQALVDHKRHAREHRGRHRLIHACPSAKTFLESVALHGGHLGGTTSRLLRLLDQHGHEPLEKAIGEAITSTAFTAASVSFLLERASHAATREPVAPMVLPADPRAHNIVVQRRSLAAYDELHHDSTEAS
jgi:transposase